MDCREALLMIPSRLDGALTKEEEDALARHVAGCQACAGELALQERLSGALRALGREEIPAPPALRELVMAKIRAERHRTALTWLPAAWRKQAAAAAVVLLIAGSSAGITIGLKNNDAGKTIGLAPKQPAADVGNGGDVSAPPAGGGYLQPGDPGQLPEGAGTAAEPRGDGASESVPGYDNPGNPVNEPAAPKTSAETAASAAPVTAAGGHETRALLSSSVKVARSQLKMSVNDLNEARIKAVSLAAGAGAATQVFPEQDGDKKIVLIRITSSSECAADLLSGLNGLGTVFDRHDESQDITSLYNEKLVQLNDLQSRIGSVQSGAEQQQMEAQIASYKQQFDIWEEEAGKHVIMLWLEGR
ncbi:MULTISPECIES: zf-HC2 domain-containing protein [Pelotomaculum]|uniref:Anti-sigma-W factor RsiW n=1 Tax=Pelotomaculum isophthalicicum JI TaxID=947010 RepID=A0A9X4H3U9_9FIRM|nr:MULTISPECIES: zf-HC2 domain-containing protein [Pelotomaculum]MDF9409870.1 zf-HC2 domain-containing protein [Pelotomaculum isophthalicicum JI]OPX89028.1 MAG: hypothetical protein A4E54_01114 [Pelotomaculum sp. PtaB.Bin117]